jgi:hypothetical protein
MKPDRLGRLVCTLGLPLAAISVITTHRFVLLRWSSLSRSSASVSGMRSDTVCESVAAASAELVLAMAE